MISLNRFLCLQHSFGFQVISKCFLVFRWMQQSVLHAGASPYLPNGGRYKSFEDSILLLSFFHCSLKTEYLNKLKVSYIIMQFNKLYHFYRIFTRSVWLTRGFIFFKISAHTWVILHLNLHGFIDNFFRG